MSVRVYRRSCGKGGANGRAVVGGPAWRSVAPRVAAYLGHRTPVDGPGELRLQKAAVDACALSLGAAPPTYYVDAGRRDGDADLGDALMRLLGEAASGAFDVVVVRHLADLAEDYTSALRVAVALRAYVEVHEALGGEVLFDERVAVLVGAPAC